MQTTLTGEPIQEQKPRYKREEWLREQYVERGKTTPEISDMADCADTTVLRYLHKHGIETRKGGPHTSHKLRREEWLREQYVEQGKSTYEIADMVDCSHTTVLTHINKHDIETRTGGQPVSDKVKREEWLREQYVEQGKNTLEIADMADCSGKTVRVYIHKHGIETRKGGPHTSDKVKREEWLREQYVERGKTSPEISDMVDCSHTTVLTHLNKHDIETRTGGPHTSHKLRREDWLREQYVEQRKSTYEIADMVDCSQQCVLRHLDKHGIETRSRGLSGADHPSYAGGHAEYGSGWNKNKRRAVRERDGNACRNCGMSQEQHRRQYNRRLDVHHITKAREFDDADKRNAMNNLVALCRECHLGHFERMADTGLQPQIPGVNYPNE
jgi:DNA-binding CsgD family transcriptional regulator